jgi:hypothetical protein
MNVRTAGGAFVAAALVAARASAADAPRKVTDGVYGRFDGDLDLSVAAGGAAARGGSGGVAMLRATFLHTAGLYTAYTDALGSATTAPRRTAALGVGLRPLFLPRWGLDLERGPAILDLTIDAFSLDLGVVWPSDERGGFTRSPGLELALGTEVPLLARAAGPWIGVRGALRWPSADLSGTSDVSPVLGNAFFVTFAWYFMANVHLVDVGDRIAR